MNQAFGVFDGHADARGGDIISRQAGAGLDPGPAATSYPNCIFAKDSQGVVATCSISDLRQARYGLSIAGSVFSPAGLGDSFITITQAPEGVVLHRESLLGAYRTERGACFSLVFGVPDPSRPIEIAVSAASEAQFRIDALGLSDTDYLFNFAIVNKSYRKDLPWTVVLYRSWWRFSQVECPFYIVVPAQDLPTFVDAFRAELDARRIGRMPNIVTEEWVFAVGGIAIPAHYSGWQTQQIVKLGFSKTRIARQYLTVDSTMFFTKPFDYHRLLKDGVIYTAANRTSRSDFFEYFRRVDEKGWLNGNLVNISESFDAMCAYMGNTTNETNAYISCTGMFNSDLALELEAYAYSQGTNGFTGLIDIAPYEFAWYGEFVFSQRRSQFVPHDPHLMTLAHAEEHARTLREGALTSEDRHMGIMLQPPASELCEPEAIYAMVADGRVR